MRGFTGIIFTGSQSQVRIRTYWHVLASITVCIYMYLFVF